MINYKDLFDVILKEFTINGEVHKRYFHTIGVVEMALTLNKKLKLNIDSDKVFASAILHDVAKLMPKEEMLDILKDEYSDLYEELKDYPNVWHSFVGAYVAKTKYNIQDNEVLDAIKYHTTGKINMNNLEKLIFVSDYIEKITRNYESMIETRMIAYKSLDDALVKTLSDTIEYLKKEEKAIYSLTLDTYNYYLEKGRCNVQ